MSFICSVNVGGSNTHSCGSYPSCNSTCCTNDYSSCSGTTSGCPGKTQAQCTAMGACCSWQGVAPASCFNVTCTGMSEANCGACSGCTKSGSCGYKSCASGAGTSLITCTGCGNCSGTATLSGTVDLRSYWSVTTRVFSTTAAADSITMDATHILGSNNAI
jgi:hypothetical protein